MRPLIFSLGVGTVLAGVALAQSASDSGGGVMQLPVGQVFKQFEFPVYQEGKLKYTLNATEARGITLNRAETSDLKIEIYDNGAVSTTITSPKADLLVSEQKMRTKNTVQIERADMQATAQEADFDVKAKRFHLRTNVKVVLKHFDVGGGHAAAASPTAPTSVQPYVAPVMSDDAILPSTNPAAESSSAPIPPSGPLPQ